MSIIIEKKSNETPVALADRFSKEIRRSSVLKKAKQARFHERTQNDTAQKKRALNKIKAREKYYRLKKMGQI